jgi:hypothetical protein
LCRSCSFACDANGWLALSGRLSLNMMGLLSPRRLVTQDPSS